MSYAVSPPAPIAVVTLPPLPNVGSRSPAALPRRKRYYCKEAKRNAKHEHGAQPSDYHLTLLLTNRRRKVSACQRRQKRILPQPDPQIRLTLERRGSHDAKLTSRAHRTSSAPEVNRSKRKLTQVHSTIEGPGG